MLQVLHHFFQYKDTKSNVIYQGQFDDPISLNFKYKLAHRLSLRGVGMWNIDSLDYADTQQAETMRKEMFSAFDAVR